MKTKINHFGSGCVVFIISIISLSVWIHVVHAAPPGKTYKERRAMAESDKNIKVGMSYADIQANTFTGPIIESTGFELADGFDPPNPETGFSGFICGEELKELCHIEWQFPRDCTNPNNGWGTSPPHCNEPHIDTVHPSSGDQHLRFTRAAGLEDGHPDGCIGFAGACRITAFSPDPGHGKALPIGPVTISIDVASTGRFSSSFIAWFLPEGAAGNVFEYIYFDAGGGIYALQDGVRFDYLAEWSTPGYGNLTIINNPCIDSVIYKWNGQTVLTLDETTTPTVNQSWVNRAILRTDNGEQNWDVDNFSIVRGDPCPTTCGADGIEAGEQCEFGLICFGGDNDGDTCDTDADCPAGSCLEGDALCPGQCIAIGEEGECRCIVPHTAPCLAGELANGETHYLTDGGWYTFVADTTATAIDTCGSVGFDSNIVIFDSPTGDCYGVAVGLVGNDDCGTDAYGAYSDPLASCFDRAGPGQGPGFPWESCTCIPTTVGTRYWVWQRNVGGALGTDSVVNLTKRLDCAEPFEVGTCCDDASGVCTDGATAATCTGDLTTYSHGKTCASPSVNCIEIDGACCDRLDGFCSSTTRANCSGAQPLWTPSITCGEVVCDPAMGACCNTRFGTCTQDILANCQGLNLNWTKGDSCNDQICPDPFVPAVSQWGLIVLTLLLLITAKTHYGRTNGEENT